MSSRKSSVATPRNSADSKKDARCFGADKGERNEHRKKSAPREDRLSTKENVEERKISNGFTRTSDLGKKDSTTTLSETDETIDPLKSAFDKLKDHYDSLPLKTLFDTIASRGICPNEDVRLAPIREALQQIYRGRLLTDIVINFETFKKVSEPARGLLLKIIENNLTITDVGEWIKCFTLYYSAIKEITGKDLVICLTSADGQKIKWGQNRNVPTLDELVHVVLYLMATEAVGFTKLHENIGMEAEPSSEWTPGNPLVGAGALMVAARLVDSAMDENDPAQRHQRVKETIADMAGGADVRFDSKSFVGSERRAEYLKAVLSWMLVKEKERSLRRKIDTVVRFYLECSSLLVDAEALSVLGATLANGGVCSTTGRKVVCSENVANVLSMMTVSSGMAGVPLIASSTGAVLLVVPSLLSVAIYSEDLTASGLLISALGRHFALNPYERLFLNMKPTEAEPQRAESVLFDSSKNGDILTLASLLYSDVVISTTDFMSRNILHLAALSGHLTYIAFAVNLCPRLVLAKDSMGLTPADTARFFKYGDIAEFLENWETVLQSPAKISICSSRKSIQNDNM